MYQARDLFKLETSVSGLNVKKRRETTCENAPVWFKIREADKHSRLKYFIFVYFKSSQLRHESLSIKWPIIMLKFILTSKIGMLLFNWSVLRAM
jgi:hypothetical protein